jgi:hypothetical protein
MMDLLTEQPDRRSSRTSFGRLGHGGVDLLRERCDRRTPAIS